MLKNKKDTTKSIITYKDSGVDIDNGNKLISDISKITDFDQLPETAKQYIAYISDITKVNISMISVGSKRNQTIHLLTHQKETVEYFVFSIVKLIYDQL